MEDHVVLDVDRLSSSPGASTASPDSCAAQEHKPLLSSARALQQSPQSEHVVIFSPASEEEYVEGGGGFVVKKGKTIDDDLASFGGATGVTVECRICQEEDDVGNLEAPCACSGSVKYAHRKCVQRWCNEKGDTTCEICQKPYQPGYTAPPRPVEPEGTPIDLSGNWGITGPHQLDLRDPRILAMAAERHFLDSDYDEYASANASSAACCRSAALILMALLLLRHALAMASSGADDDTSALFTVSPSLSFSPCGSTNIYIYIYMYMFSPCELVQLFLLRAAGFLLPCYIMLRALSILQRRRQQQEATMAEVAILIQAGQAARNGQFPPAVPPPPPPPQSSASTIPVPAAT
ncbi:uncharacterized protein LOC9635593 isoform X1 [Selaginella moellendorffii]|uniref:uncharacterized protein LOC9635593 isoform X1 n=1 Tax=Selaginella moellendorffii TaxID=88036 RepID=UPI000D1CF65F|nr:uncharacterized protein LOC9635593 isoform X1 [Selaginella moellendorffii]|eukprot:XP_024542948.1 uncharacterized protein LOC9635593 isoform X1 [Selaginella moellendorffii]